MTSGIYLTEDVERKICELYLSGKSSIQIGMELNLSKPCILKRLEKNNIPRRHKLKKYSSKKEYNDFLRKNLKLRVLNYYSDGMMKCSCCGESNIEFLTIDHINGGGSKHRKQIGANNINRWLIKNNFPVGYRILCMNCNFSIGVHGYCPHNKIIL